MSAAKPGFLRIVPLAAGAIAAAAMIGGGGCNGNGATVVLVSVDKHPGIPAVIALAATAQNGGQMESKTFDVRGRSFPLTFTVQPTGRTGILSLALEALDGTGTERGVARGSVAIVPNQLSHLDIGLQPTDFVVNTQFAGTQKLTFEQGRGGVQVGTAADGSFAITFVNDCGNNSQCNVFGRIFAPDGTPRVNGITKDAKQFTANLDTGNPLSVPAIAVGASGMFIVWQSPQGISGVALDGGAAQKNTADVSIAAVPGATNPDVAALAGGGFVVVWSQSNGTAQEIRARLLDADGQPVTNPNTGDNTDFAVSTTGDASNPAVAATGDGEGFVATWEAGGEAYARFFDKTGAPTASQEGQITMTGSGGTAFGARIAASPGHNAVIAWGASVSGAASKTGYFVRTFAPPAGAPTGPPTRLTTAIPDMVSAPDVAVLADGTIGAVWTSCGKSGDGNGCGVFLQVLRATGLPIGAPITVDTTIQSDQKDPAIAAGKDSFVITWSDGSSQPPDTSGGAVRARIFYPDLNPTDGGLGARCGGGGAPCGSGLVCARGSDGGAYCQPKCDKTQAVPCPSGGRCEGPVCVF